MWHLLTSWWPAWQPSRLFHLPARHWWDSKPVAIMPPLTVWDQADALPTELSRLGFMRKNLLRSKDNSQCEVKFKTSAGEQNSFHEKEWNLFMATFSKHVHPHYYRPQEKVMFSQASVSHSVHNQPHGYSVTAHHCYSILLGMLSCLTCNFELIDFICQTNIKK